jgi:hypothetical protein
MPPPFHTLLGGECSPGRRPRERSPTSWSREEQAGEGVAKRATPACKATLRSGCPSAPEPHSCRRTRRAPDPFVRCSRRGRHALLASRWMALARRTSTSRGSSGRTSSQRGCRRTLDFSMRIRFIGSPAPRRSGGASRSPLGRGSSPFREGCPGARPPASTTVARGRRVRRPIAGRPGAGPSRSSRAA